MKKTSQAPPGSEGHNTKQKHQQTITPSDSETPSPPAMRVPAKTLLTSTWTKKTSQAPPGSEGRNTKQKHQQTVAPSDSETPAMRVPATGTRTEQEKSDRRQKSKPPATRQTNKPPPARQLQTPSTGNKENSGMLLASYPARLLGREPVWCVPHGKSLAV